MNSTWYIIINPTSGNGSAIRKWEGIKNHLLARSVSFEYHFSQFHKHAITFAKEAANSGYKKIIAVGGDGTINQIVNGILQSINIELSTIKVGIIPIGTGNDWAKHHNIPSSVLKSIQIIEKEYVIYQDIGRIRTNDSTHFFINSAGIGFDGYVAKHVKQYKYLGKLSYLIAALIGIVNYKRSLLKINFNDIQIKQNSLILVIGICKYSGGGMRLTSEVFDSDGLFDISYIATISPLNLLKNIVNVFNGKLASQSFVANYKSKSLTVQCPDNNFSIIQADGEIIGLGSFSAEIITNKIRFIVSR
jgi:YegS/Rv2252/BmrU family lipid kinase